MFSRERTGLILPSKASIKAAKATKAITLAVIIKIKRPAPKIESPKNEKNGSRSGFLLTVSSATPSEPDSMVSVLSPEALPPILAIVSSSGVTVTGFKTVVTIIELTMLIGTAAMIY